MCRSGGPKDEAPRDCQHSDHRTPAPSNIICTYPPQPTLLATSLTPSTLHTPSPPHHHHHPTKTTRPRLPDQHYTHHHHHTITTTRPRPPDQDHSRPFSDTTSYCRTTARPPPPYLDSPKLAAVMPDKQRQPATAARPATGPVHDAGHNTGVGPGVEDEGDNSEGARKKRRYNTGGDGGEKSNSPQVDTAVQEHGRTKAVHAAGAGQGKELQANAAGERRRPRAIELFRLKPGHQAEVDGSSTPTLGTGQGQGQHVEVIDLTGDDSDDGDGRAGA